MTFQERTTDGPLWPVVSAGFCVLRSDQGIELGTNLAQILLIPVLRRFRAVQMRGIQVSQ